MPNFANVVLTDTFQTWLNSYNAISRHFTVVSGGANNYAAGIYTGDTVRMLNAMEAPTAYANTIYVRTAGVYSGTQNFANSTITLGVGAIANTYILGGGVTAYNIANGSISNTHIQQAAVGSYALANSSVTTSHISATGTANSTTYLSGNRTWDVINTNVTANTQIAAGVVDSAALAPNSVTDSELKALAVTAGKIATGAVNANTIFAQGVIDAWPIANSAISEPKLHEENIALYGARLQLYDTWSL